MNGRVDVKPPQTAEDHEWLRDLWRTGWGGETMISKGREHHIQNMEPLIAWHQGMRAGAATYRVEGAECELMSLNASVEGRGIGGALLTSVEDAARRAGSGRIWLITSNDNVDALRFYQRKGYRMTAVYPGAVDEARKQKPSIPLIGCCGIPVHDEIELEKRLEGI